MSHVMLKSVIRMPFDVAMGDHFSRLQFYQRAQQALSELEALQAKLAEQHAPIAWLHEETGDVISSELKDDAPEMLKGYDVPLYRCPVPNSQGILDSSNHIADMRKMVADMYWISDEFSTETILDAFDPIVSMIDVSVGDTFEVKRAKTLPSITVEVTEMTEYGDVKAYKVVGGDHIPDASKMVVPDGWQLVPIEPADEMLVSGQEELVLGKRGAMEDCEESKAIFKAMLAAAPKHTGEK